MDDKGCAYGQVTRQLAEDIKGQVDDIKEKLIAIDMKMDTMNSKAQQMFNHMSNRAPHWASTIITIMAGLLGVTIGIILK